MHRLSFRALALASLGAASVGACGKAKPADTPNAKAETDGGRTADEASKGTTAATDREKETKDGGAPGEPKKDECIGFEIGKLEDMLLKSSCEEQNVKPDGMQNVDLKGKLEVSVSASPTKVAPGGKTDLLVAFTNKSKEPLTLHFRINPVPYFLVEAYDKKGKRVDMPAGSPPPPPKGATAPAPSESKAARLTIAANGSARVTIPWEAVKTKWAPEKYRGTPAERGYPRAAAGPLPKGKYTVKVLTPLVGVFEGSDKEVSAPKVEIEVGG